LTKIHFTENDDLLDICKDNVFKAVFTKDMPASKEALGRLVSALVGRELSIVTITANEPPVDDLRDRQIRFDISCKAENGELVNVEMGLNPSPSEPVRLEFHAGKLFTRQDIRGKDKSYKDLKQAYQITILANERFFEDDVTLHTFEYYDPLHGVSLNGRSRIITLELSKLDKVVEKPAKNMSAPEHWGVFFRYLQDKAKRGIINEILELEEGIAMASEVLITVTKEEREQAWLRSREKYELDIKSNPGYARQVGHVEGRAEGLAKGLSEGHAKGLTDGKQEIINLLKSGKSPEEILREYGTQ
jgi:predicted transposase/invertase (TIGR01784 family)